MLSICVDKIYKSYMVNPIIVNPNICFREYIFTMLVATIAKPWSNAIFNWSELLIQITQYGIITYWINNNAKSEWSSLLGLSNIGHSCGMYHAIYFYQQKSQIRWGCRWNITVPRDIFRLSNKRRNFEPHSWFPILWNYPGRKQFRQIWPL